MVLAALQPIHRPVFTISRAVSTAWALRPKTLPAPQPNLEPGRPECFPAPFPNRQLIEPMLFVENWVRSFKFVLRHQRSAQPRSNLRRMAADTRPGTFNFGNILMLSRLGWLLGLVVVLPVQPSGRFVVYIDAAKSPPAAQPLPFPAGGRSPSGHVLAVNSRYLTFDAQPWFPVMGEFHFSRFPAARWEEEILKMKAGGVTVVSTYIFWIHHEEIEAHFDWSGQRDLRRFVELCARHGMYVWIRIGPWDHGEARNGGFPDWLLRKCAVRRNDPVYLSYVRRWYDEIGKQVKGQSWKDGGPIIGIQLENEYHERGAGEGEDHILTLKRLAQEAGLETPFDSITAWDDAVLPARGLLPVFGGYADGFWQRSLAQLAPNANYFFTGIRCDENVGPDLRSKRPDLDARLSAYPYLTAEMGGGMEASYHRRPIITADDTAAMVLTKLGSGVTLYGYYMFHGGANPDGIETTLQESQATGYPNDLPEKGYDYQAPLGEFGQVHESFRDLKTFHLFLQDFGSMLATMVPTFPQRMPASRDDRETTRAAFRGNGRRGFLFINNYQKDYPLPDRKAYQAEITLATGTLLVPQAPLDIPSGAYTFWPVNLDLGGAVLEYATAQLLSRLGDTWVFFAWPGVEAQFAVRGSDGRLQIRRINPGNLETFAIGGAHVLVLSREQARNLWKARIGGQERLILSPADLFFDGNRVVLRSTDVGRLSLSVFPPIEQSIPGFQSAAHEGIFERYTARVEPVRVAAELRELAAAAADPPVKMGPEVVLAPVEADFAGAARWSIRVPQSTSSLISNVFLDIDYVGDVAHLYAGDRLISDEFYSGVPWTIGLRDLPATLELRILPLRPDAPIYLDPQVRRALPSDPQVVRLRGVRAVPEYQAIANLR